MTLKPQKFALLAFILVAVFLCSQSSFAQEVLSVSKSYRSMAMGNTGVASATDSAALIYNPAILANTEGWWFDYAAWTIEISEGFSPQELAPVIISPTLPYINRNGLDNFSRPAFIAKENPFVRANAGMTLSANIMKEGLSVAGTYQMETMITMIDNGKNIYQRDDLIKQYGMSIPFAMGRFILGFSRKDITRRIAIDPSTDTSLPNWTSRYQAASYDVGLLYRMANAAHLTWGLVAYNVGGLKFTDASMDAEPTYALGVSTNHEFGIFKLMTALDVREISSSAAKTNTVHAGAELGIFPNSTGGSYFTYRVGYNQGYTTQGAEINLFNHSVIIGWTNYGEEVGEGTETAESRRTVYYFSMGF